MNKELIARKLRELRGEKSREEVAIAVGVTASAISMYECGARVPHDEIKVRLAKYFGCSVQDIFYSDEVNRCGHEALGLSVT